MTSTKSNTDQLRRCLAFAVLCLLGSVQDPANAQSAPDNPPRASELETQSQRCGQLLRSSVVDFYLPNAVDTVHGGYWENIDEQGQFHGTNVKFLTLQARQLWFFSRLASADIQRAAALDAAHRGYRFLQAKFRDADFGGYFSKVQDDGKPLDERKHVYLNAFVIYALSAYYQATGDAEVLAEAQQLFRTLEQHARDSEHGGYQEWFARDWTLITDANQAGYVGAVNTKTYNSHLHLLEAFAELYRHWPDPLVADRLTELIRINTSTVRHPQWPCNIDGWSPAWKMIDAPRNLRASYGHDVECAWLVLDASKTLGWPSALLRPWAETICGYSLQYGYDYDHGGFFYTGPLGVSADDRHKEWWVQAEGLVSMLEMYRLTGNTMYYQRFAETLDFAANFQIAPEGGWWASRQADGSALSNNSRTSMWQAGYHNGRALLQCQQLLKQMAMDAR